MREQVLGQFGNGNFSVETPQVVVQQPAELPKWCVDFVTLPPAQGDNVPRRLITVVDTEAKRIAVYRLNVETGEVKLLSVRNIQHDLMFDQLNALQPLPSEIMQWNRQTQQSKGRN